MQSRLTHAAEQSPRMQHMVDKALLTSISMAQQAWQPPTAWAACTAVVIDDVVLTAAIARLITMDTVMDYSAR